MRSHFLRFRRRSVRKPWKSTFSITTLSFNASSPRIFCEYSHNLGINLKFSYIARNYSHCSTPLLLIVWVYFIQIFLVDAENACILKQSAKWLFEVIQASKVIDFATNRKRVCDFLLVINSNLGPISCPVSEIKQVFCWEERPHWSYSTRILGCSPWNRLPMLWLRDAKILN